MFLPSTGRIPAHPRNQTSDKVVGITILDRANRSGSTGTADGHNQRCLCRPRIRRDECVVVETAFNDRCRRLTADVQVDALLQHSRELFCLDLAEEIVTVHIRRSSRGVRAVRCACNRNLLGTGVDSIVPLVGALRGVAILNDANGVGRVLTNGESEVKALGGDAIALRFHDRREVDTQMRELRRYGVAILLSDAEVIGIVEVRRCGELVDGFRSAFDRLGIAASASQVYHW